MVQVVIRKQSVLIGLVLLWGVAGSGCGDGSGDKTETGAPSAAQAEAELARQINTLRDYYRHRQYRNIEPVVAENSRRELTRLLLAADRLLVANGHAMEMIRRDHTPTFTARWDLNFVANGLGIFSADYKTIDVTTTNSRGVVHYQVGRALPLREAYFVRDKTRWIYQPEVLAGLAVRIDKLATALDRIAEDFSRESPTREHVVAEYRRRVLPIVREMETLSQSPSTGSVDDRTLSAAYPKR